MKSLVVKYGGAAMRDEFAARAIIQEMVSLVRDGLRLVLLHGGGPEIERMLSRLGVKSEKIQGLRVTDANCIEVVEMVMAGKINKQLVSLINAAGGQAVGLSGRDAGLFIAAKKELPEGDLGFVGTIKKANVKIVDSLLEGGYFPVVCPIADDGNGQAYNINADEAAGVLAAAMHSERVIILTDVAGLLKNFPDPASRIPSLRASEAGQLIESGAVDSGMIPKLRASLDMIRQGVFEVQIIDGRKAEFLREAVKGKGDIGTTIRA